jgi:replicative DNA helicase
MRRRIAAAGAALASIEGDDLAEVADRARAIVDAAIGVPTQRVQFVADILPRLEARMTADKVFIPSPWESLNDKIGGFRPGAVYVVAARPGDGKTILGGQIATHLAQHGNVAFSSLEMGDEELVARMVSERARINVGHIKDARMEQRDWSRLDSVRPALQQLRIAIDDRAGVSAADVRAFVRSVAKLGPLAGAVVDYMQLMTTRDRLDRHLQVADFSRRLKIMAKDFHIPVVALSQLNRNSVASSLAVPKLSDLRESGAIEQDADVVLLLRREGEFPNEALIIDVAKNRHGETGEVSLAWDGGYSRAVEWNHRDWDGDSQ